MYPTVIKDESTYTNYLLKIERLMEQDPTPDSSDGRMLELLTHLVEHYETEKFPIDLVDPVDAILFRMEQMSLRQIDLVPFLGSRSKVSEIMARKRPLTLSMIQALNKGMGIPADVLLRPMNEPAVDEGHLDWSRFPTKEMISRGWISVVEHEVETLQNAVAAFFASVGGPNELVCLNRSSPSRSGREMNRFALAAWTTRVIQKAKTKPLRGRWKPGALTLETCRSIAKLSVFPDGPLRAQERLSELGISLVIEPQLKKTYLDGSAILMFDDHPIVGMTLRYDRVDNFWFTLMHELAHVTLHYRAGRQQFLDDLDIKDDDDPLEREADEFSAEVLVPQMDWIVSPARVAPSVNAIVRLAQKIEIHPAIIAGKLRRERNSFHLFSDMVGHNRIRVLFDFE